ncbi:hypothetical protein TELCIR_06311 [Teladorsagia circumcincta]|uniref:Reverse transcriptase domain-containing protein n=1 Tax=Teladorsagia circumcincta TaxID=45464 RepID=A0A2G9UND0_TELCI|nr:hypothetical protein TELCIR_06311 [Teladorsagia circumcincta]
MKTVTSSFAVRLHQSPSDLSWDGTITTMDRLFGSGIIVTVTPTDQTLQHKELPDQRHRDRTEQTQPTTPEVEVNGHPIDLLLDTELVEPLQRYVSGVTIVADPAAAYREKIVAKWKTTMLKVVFKTGLGRCTKTKTTLRTERSPMQHQHPLPTPDDIFTKLNGGTTFMQIDFADAYLQVEVDDEANSS